MADGVKNLFMRLSGVPKSTSEQRYQHIEYMQTVTKEDTEEYGERRFDQSDQEKNAFFQKFVLKDFLCMGLSGPMLAYSLNIFYKTKEKHSSDGFYSLTFYFWDD